MASIEEVVERVNQRVAELRDRVGSVTGDRIGTEGRDRLFGGFGNDTILGLGGDDFISGGAGNDFLDGGDGRDDLSGGLGDDYIIGGNGNDRVFGQIGNDLLYGDAGNDLMDGSIGSDIIFGGDGNDNITGGANGDPNADLFFFADFLVGGTGSDTLRGYGGGTGAIEIDYLVGGGTVDPDGNIDFYPGGNFGDGNQDIFILGDANGAFYAQGLGEDYAVIFDFEAGIDQIQLGSVANPGLATSSVFSEVDTLIFTDDTFTELVAVVVGVDLT